MARRPRIGVSACLDHADPQRRLFKGKTLVYAEESMLQWIMSGGAVPVLLPRASGPVTAAELLAGVDALLLQGGADLAPEHYGEEPARPEWKGDADRDRYELELVDLCVRARKPLLGICRGHQLINVAFGGTLWQDIATMHPARRVHRDWDVYDRLGHEIRIEPETWLGQWYGFGQGGGVAHVNSVHHQGIKTLGQGLVVEARSEPDGIIEAIRLDVRDKGSGDPLRPHELFVYGVQWHPEFMFALPRPGQLLPTTLLEAFVEAAVVRR
jgi:putative glutamine amidotransferase